MNQYHLVFNGSVSDGHNLAEVKRNLASLFKTDDTKIEQMFACLPFVVKRNVDYDAAVKYQKALRRAGAICQVEDAIKNTRPPVMEKAAPPPLMYNPATTFIEDEETPQSKTANSTESQKKGIKGLGDIVSGLVLIGIGFVLGGSTFMGDARWLDYRFDGLGLFWIGRGIYKMVR
jgi:hypothetical protein